MNAILERRGSDHFRTPNSESPAVIDWSQVQINEFGHIVSTDIGHQELVGEFAIARYYVESCTDDYLQRSHPCMPATGVEYWEIPIVPQDVLYFYRLSWEYMIFTSHTERSRGFMNCARQLEGKSSILFRKFEGKDGKIHARVYTVS